MSSSIDGLTPEQRAREAMRIFARGALRAAVSHDSIETDKDEYEDRGTTKEPGQWQDEAA